MNLRSLFKSNIFKAAFLLTFVVNLFFIHVVFQQFILCYENDGRIVIERLNEDECSKEDLTSLSGVIPDCGRQDHCDICIDFSAVDKYGDSKSKSVKNVIAKTAPATLVVLTDVAVNTSAHNLFSSKPELNISSPLEAYKTVSLLI